MHNEPEIPQSDEHQRAFYKAQWDSDPKIRKDFMTFADFFAYKKADTSGRVQYSPSSHEPKDPPPIRKTSPAPVPPPPKPRTMTLAENEVRIRAKQEQMKKEAEERDRMVAEMRAKRASGKGKK